jgi:hypothetical protein
MTEMRGSTEDILRTLHSAMKGRLSRLSPAEGNIVHPAVGWKPALASTRILKRLQNGRGFMSMLRFVQRRQEAA